MPEPIQVRALEAIRLRLEAIAIADDYRTDVGANVDYGPYYPAGEECPLLQIVDGGDENPNPRRKTGRDSPIDGLTQTVYIDAFTRLLRDERYTALHLSRVRADVKNALLDPGVQRLSDDDGPIGPISYLSSSPIATPDGSDVIGMRLTFALYPTENPGRA